MIIGLLISDRWLNEKTPGLNASYLVFPFLIFSFSKYSTVWNKNLLYSLLIYIVILTFFFVLSAGEGFTLLTTTIGTTLIAIASLNTGFRDIFIRKIHYIYLTLTMIIVIAYYLNMWEYRTQTSDRLTFMYNNENIIAHQLCEGLAFCLFTAFSKIKLRWLFLVASLLYLIPIVSTISRTGIAIMLITILIFSYSRLQLKGLLIALSCALLVSVAGLVPNLSFLSGNKLYLSFLERSSETTEDIRFQLWRVGWNIAKENILTGVGFGNYESDSYRYRIGELANLGFDGYGSPHNSFIDLIWIGGIWLVSTYIVILYWAIQGGFRLLKSSHNEIRNIGALVLSLITGVLLFSMTGQAATDKRTWFIIAICYLWVNEADKRSQLKSLS
ncbi:MAG: O-antigen ligase family protein [Saprospiraceae bacterium]|nr:O-antigen ligase family protein [Saprospiraceae bacterium]